MTISVIDESKAEWAADKFIDYFQNFSSIEDYLRYAKGQAVSSMAVIPGISDKAVSYTHLTLPTTPYV